MAADPDEELVRRVGAGEPAAVQTLVARKLPRILALAVRMLGDAAEAEDVAQETFVRIWRHAASWRRGNARFDSWIHRVTLNLCYDRLRRRREWVSGDLPEMVDPAALPDAPRQEDAVQVERALQAIAPRQREAIVLVYYQEMSNIEAAATLQISVDALESLLARGRRSLQAILAGDGADE
ncbi:MULTISPECIES: RNA polymerase sigma factor [unclassified Mesorhizobium]|uniref:RNA polymerase sigma factor n=1 Tax=unclassified Mesorhizobium TaxID=325217 RepID=UPI000FC9E29E|nr:MULTISPECIES: RNA polymerase sigma factor [unclassified Mesorhizobium]RUU61981.1 RNA polymerase sigma factor [Mesorhizobium sp. M7A.T.Ca.TU.009.01.1.1]RUU72268.1 RNA polymerase sigma factor [Mesorhizobium sp. M7A.T.Ca.TU.009.01.1.2]RUT85457.1 RNA polymerase sigma factor [Mesorhizobium sp. M7A.T.Ca.US.000.02.1.1]RUT94666.1 RNA polymerase sigma factor [Mesorhizobium sp. M7A.T.Ca.US.000.02.2.1]RUU03645.1 RNA polymerase sigma factor [Mesorhizobium sp. M7A.T.Ca.TU.009.02.1.1]